MRGQTYETEHNMEERAIIVSVVLKSGHVSEERIQYSLDELRSLAETAGVEVLDTVVQQRDSIDKAWFVGKGKAEEIRQLALLHQATVVLFDQELSGAQVRNLEQALDMKIIDRTQLILDIFAGRAKTREGILQVELAQLQYLLPRLAGQYKNLSRLGGGIGTRGPGETKLETDRRHIQNRIRDLREQLHEVTRHRRLHRARRGKTGVIQVALVGYTNAGKSTLLNQLTNAGVLAENQLFATLDPTSRQLTLPNGVEIIVTDTVGFIQQLPHDLIAAFRSTLEEVNEADLILHVVDSSSAMIDTQMHVVNEVLQELGAHGKEQIVLFNKIDLVTDEQKEWMTASVPSMKISAYAAADLERLVMFLQDKLSGEVLTYKIPAARGDLIAKLFALGDVLEQEADGEFMDYRIRVNKDKYEKMGFALKEYIGEK